MPESISIERPATLVVKDLKLYRPAFTEELGWARHGYVEACSVISSLLPHWSHVLWPCSTGVRWHWFIVDLEKSEDSGRGFFIKVYYA